MCLFAIHMSSSEKWLLKPCACILFGCLLITEFWEFFIYSVYKFSSHGCFESVSPVCGWCFHYFKVFFKQHKLLILVKSSMSVFSFIDHSFEVIDHSFEILSKKSLSNSWSQRFSLMLFSGSFIVLGFTFRSMRHLKLIFVKGVRRIEIWNSFSFFFAYGYPLVLAF